MRLLLSVFLSSVWIYSSVSVACSPAFNELLDSAETVIKKNLVDQPSGCLSVVMSGINSDKECPSFVINVLTLRLYPFQQEAIAQCNQCGPATAKCRRLLEAENIRRSGFKGLKSQLKNLNPVSKASFDPEDDDDLFDYEK